MIYPFCNIIQTEKKKKIKNYVELVMLGDYNGFVAKITLLKSTLCSRALGFFISDIIIC